MAILNHGSTLRTADGGQTTTAIVTASNIGTYGVATNSTYYVGTTQNIFNRASGAQSLTGVSIDGNAGTATILQTARNINGTSFNGSAAITTASWGTARTLTIGSTGKSVDGSAAVTWSLAEIGAAATNQTMFIGTTSVAINRTSASQTLTGISIDGSAASCTGNAATVTNGVYTTGDQTISGIKYFTSTVDPSTVPAGYAGGYILESTTGFGTYGIIFGSATGQHGAIGYSSNTMYFGTENGTDNTLNTKATLSSGGTFTANGDVRAPIFYDSNNTAYYLDPANTGTSLLVAGSVGVSKTSIRSGSILDVNGYGCFGASAYGFYIGTDATGAFLDAGSQLIRMFAGSSEKVRIDASGNLGVGITSLVHKIQAAGLISAGDATYNNNSTFIGAILNNDQTNPGLDLRRWNGGGAGTNNHGATYIATNSAGDTLFYNGLIAANTRATNEKMRISVAGNVGIGTTSPGYKLDVNGTFRTATNNLTIFNDYLYVSPTENNTFNSAYSTNGIADMWINYAGYNNGNTQFRNFNVGNGKNAIIAWFDGTNKRMSINNSQAASYPLHVVGTAYSDTDFRAPIFYDSNDTAYYVDPNSISRLSSLRVYSAFDTASSDVYANMRVINDTAFSDGMFIGYANAGSGLTRLFGGGATTGALIKYSDYTAESNSFRAPIFYDSDNTAYYLDAANSGTSLLVAGKVGIGTTSPTSLLHLAGVGGDGAAFLRIAGTASDAFNWGSSVMYANLAATETAINLIGKAQSQYNSCYIGYRHVSDGSASNMLSLGLYAADHLVNILGNGNVGIGTTSPANKLHVVGSAYSDTDFRAPIFYDSNDTGYFLNPNSTSNLNNLRAATISAANHGLTCVYYGGGATPTNGYLITTNIDYSTFNMPTVIIEGYAYGNGVPIHLEIVWYAYNNSWTNLSYTNLGAWNPGTVSIGTNASGKVCLHLSSLIYYGRFNVRCIYDQGNAPLEGWTVTDATTAALTRVTTISKAELVTSITGNAATVTNGLYTSSTLTAGNLSGTIPSGVLGNSTHYVGTTAIALNRASASQTLTGISIDGNAATVSYPFNSSAIDLNGTGTTNQFSAFNVYYPSGGSYNQPLAGSQHFKILQFGRYNTDDANYWRGQMAMSFYTDRMFFRKEYLSTWGSWMEFLHTGNYADYSAFTTSLTSTVDARAPIFYDSDNTGYYLNPASSSQLSAVYANDWFRAQGNTGLYFQDKGYGITSAGAAGNSYGNASTYGTGVNGWQGWGIGSRHCMMSTGGDNFGVHDNTRSWLYYWNGTYHNFQYGYLESASSVRAPLFYDSDNTAYYIDAASTSNLNGLSVADANLELYKTQTVDMSNVATYSISNYYPVTISVPTEGCIIQIQNNLNSNAPSWSTHGGGFTLNLKWRTNGLGWGTTAVRRIIDQYFEQFTNQTICGGITQMGNSSTEVVWLRGGGQYYFKFSRNLSAAAQATTYTINSQSVSPTSTAQNTIWSSATGASILYNDQTISTTNMYTPVLYDWNNSAYYVDPSSTSNLVGLTVANTITGNISGTAGSISGFNNPVTAATANTIVYRDGSGHITGNQIFGSYHNSTDDISTGTITHIMAKFGDNYHRSATAAKVATFISGQTMNIAGSSTSCSGNAANVTGTVAIANGGTGATTLAAAKANLGITSAETSSNQSLSGTTGCTIDVAAASVHILTLSSGTVISSFTYNNRSASPLVNTVLVVLKFAGSATITWSNVVWSNSTTPTLTGANGKADVYSLTSYKGGATGPAWIGSVVGQNIDSTNL
jgi:hypothetical protein